MRPPCTFPNPAPPKVPFLLSLWDAVVMVMRGSRARGTPSPPTLVWLSCNTLSVRNSKILQSPLPSSQQGQTRGGQRTVLTASPPRPTLPNVPWAPHFPRAISSASGCPPPTHPHDVPGQTLPLSSAHFTALHVSLSQYPLHSHKG